MSVNTTSELDVRLMGSSNILNPFLGTNSASRNTMDAAHISQMLVLPNGDPMRITAGPDFEYGKYTFKVEVERACKVLYIFNKYPKGAGILNFKTNSEMVIITEAVDHTKEIDIIEINTFHCNHKFGGFKYVLTDFAKNLKIGDFIPENTVLAHSPSIKDGNYCFGLEANIVAGSFPWVIEDGIAVTEDFCRRAKSVGFGDRTAEWGRDYYPLNLYGDKNNYKPFPDIGERVRSDGLVFALRKVEPFMSMVEMTPDALMKPDQTFDILIYGEPNAIVENIDVWHSHLPETHRTPKGMERQAFKYWHATQEYEKKMTDSYHKLKAIKSSISLSHAFHNRLVRAKLNQADNLQSTSIRTFRKEKLDDWRVTVQYSYPIIPTRNHKLTDLSAGKGVITKVIPTEWAPVDKHGTRADILVDDSSTISRMNPGRIFYQAISATSDQVLRNLRANYKPDDYQGQYEYYLSYLEVVSPFMYEKQCRVEEAARQQNRLQEYMKKTMEKVYKTNLRLYIPHNTPELGTRLIKKLMDKFPVDIGPVTYMGLDGEWKTTKDDILIASVYFIMLEKIGDDWGGTSIPKRQHHGIVAKLSNSDKYAHNYREQAIRIAGESEVRNLTSVINPATVALLTSMPNNPAMCMDAVKTILYADKPTHIEKLMDYDYHRQIESRGLQYIKHILKCFGIEFDYVDETQFTEVIRQDGRYWDVDKETGEAKEVLL